MAQRIPGFGGGRPIGRGIVGPAPSRTQTTRSAVGKSVIQTQEEDVQTGRGIVPFYFYAAANDSGQMLRPGVAAAISPEVPFRGNIVAIVMAASGADTGTYTVYIDGVASDAEVTLSSATDGYVTFARGTHQIAAGSTIDLRASSVSGVNPIEGTVYVELDPTSVV